MDRATSQQEVTVLLRAWGGGDQHAFDKLAPVVYEELRRLARRYMARERREHTLQPTALVHEAYIRLADFRRLEWKNRVHFFAIAAQVMRRVLVDFARSRVSQKRGTGQKKISLDDCLNLGEHNDAALIMLDDSLTALADADPRKCKVVEMKFFGVSRPRRSLRHWVFLKTRCSGIGSWQSSGFSGRWPPRQPSES